MCGIKHTTDPDTSTMFLIPLNSSYRLPYTNLPGSVHYFEFNAMVKDHLLDKESIRRAGQLICMYKPLCIHKLDAHIYVLKKSKTLKIH